MQKGVVVFWFRRDLRHHDNTGLIHALKANYPVFPLFIFDEFILNQLEDKTDKRVQFIYQSLEVLNKELLSYGSCLNVRHGYPLDIFKKLVEEYEIHEVYANEDYEPYATKRDADILDFLKCSGIQFKLYKDQVIYAKGEIASNDGSPYSKYSAYSSKWLSDFQSNQFKINNIQTVAHNFYKQPLEHLFPLENIGFKNTGITFPGPDIAEQIVRNYHLTRNYPAKDGTTRLSIYLRFGTISIRELVLKATRLNSTFLNELIWREFFMQILWHFPYVQNSCFKKQYNNINWLNNEEQFERWCSGNTGYPLVDAGMRELKATGYMHNRIRMITASFLVKHLLIDWKWGEAWFASKLLDYELSSNNGNWQWVAGCGCDHAPYFRIFNPAVQAKKFDPENKYIIKWVPEHNTSRYIAPVVEHSMARERCLKVYKEALKPGN